ncbi:DUF2269 family protein [Paenibacillus piri]|uniref:DUF2269 family protein n=1 Tax=Paenibacillus piri TaxID=2547395 RepID=A0A4R5KJ45_9BACL|nr:DUF2269 family protein [Paenibacillus piri]TDF94808.1 DUF2269 family protein [Paenibacillus piri]
MSLWLTLHVLGVVLFLGNIITAAFWKVRADVQNDPAVIHSTVKNVMLADYVFTIPGLALIIVSGIAMAIRAGIPLSGMNWLLLSLILFAVTGIVWLAVLIPLQKSMIRYSADWMRSGVMPRAYRQASFYWAVFGIAASLLPVLILILMITKSF